MKINDAAEKGIAYNDEYFKNEMFKLMNAAGFHNMTNLKSIISLSDLGANTKIPTAEKDIVNDLISIIRILNHKFTEDLFNFRKAGEKLTKTDNLLVDETWSLDYELSVEKLKVDELIKIDRTKRAFIPVQPGEDVHIYKVDESLIPKPNEDDKKYGEKMKVYNSVTELLSAHDLVLYENNGEYRLYANTASFEYDAKDTDEELRNGLKAIVTAYIDNEMGDGILAGFGADWVVIPRFKKIIDNMEFHEENGYIYYVLKPTCESLSSTLTDLHKEHPNQNVPTATTDEILGMLSDITQLLPEIKGGE